MPAAVETETPEIVQKWDADPLVLVSRRPRVLVFPQSILLREPSKEDAERFAFGAKDQKGESVRAADRQEVTMQVNAGVTFLGSWTTAWKLLNVEDASKAPRDARGRPVPPPYDSCVLVYPTTKARTMFDGPQFRDPATRAILGHQVSQAFKRVFAWIEMQDLEVSQIQGTVGLWQTPPGYESPELMLIPLKEVFAQKGAKGQWAHASMTASLKWFKDATHLGALHDYACRMEGGWNTAMACRDRARAWPAGTITGNP